MKPSYAAEPLKNYPCQIYVFDSSFVGGLILPDERTLQIDTLYAKIKNDDVKLAPQLLWYEVANIFKNLIRRRRYTYNEVLNFIPALTALRLTSDSESGGGHTEKLLRLSYQYDISAYDAAYLELVGRKKAVLCTLDENLRKAAEAYGAAVL
ncbi:ribonuclease VapC [Spirochaetia bacterium]|nr:ribonuclease VapC [Spirochaetia bacterium]